MKLTGSNHKTGAAWNRQLALSLLRRHGALSRNDISRMTQLQGSTLSYIVRELLENNVVRVAGKRPSYQAGQKQVLLTLNPDVGWMLGVSLRPGLATLVILDAAGGRVDGIQTPIEGSLKEFPHTLHQELDRWLESRGAPAGKLLGLGIAIPGVVASDAGVVLRSVPLGAVNVPLLQLMSEEFDVPIVVDHDACFGAFAEATDGAAADVSHFVYYSVNTTPVPGGLLFNSYGSALYLQGQIHRGAFYGAGELSGPLVPAWVELTHADTTELADPEGGMPTALVDLAERISATLSPIVNFMDVQMVVLAGIARIYNRRFTAAIQARVTDQLIAIPGRAVRIVRGNWEPEAAARGAALAAFDQVVAKGDLFSGADQRKVIRSAR